MQNDHGGTVRASLVDVFENFFGDSIARLSREDIAGQPGPRVEELVAGVDAFLHATASDEYPPEAVVADSLSDPIIIPDDRTEPRTTRRAKQLALAHREVVIPMQPLMIDFRLAEHPQEASRPVEALLEWTRRNDLLVRKHVLSVAGRPSPFDVLGYDRTRQLVAEMVSAMQSDALSGIRSRITEYCQGDKSEEQDVLEAYMYGVLLDAINAGSINANLAFLDADSGHLYSGMVGMLKDHRQVSGANQIDTAALLQQLQMPSIDDIPDAEFVAIRTQSDDFEEFRSALGRVLAKTSVAATEGTDLATAFRGSLDEIHMRADALRRGVKDKALRPFLRASLQGISLGAVASTAAAAAADFTQSSVHPDALAARLLTGTALGTLLAAMFFRPPTRERRLLRFYNVLLDDSIESG